MADEEQFVVVDTTMKCWMKIPGMEEDLPALGVGGALYEGTTMVADNHRVLLVLTPLAMISVLRRMGQLSDMRTPAGRLIADLATLLRVQLQDYQERESISETVPT